MSARLRSAAALALALVIGALAGRCSRGQPAPPDTDGAAPAALESPEPMCAPDPPAAPAAPQAASPVDLVTRAEKGDLDALKSLDEKGADTRTSSEVVALYEGHGALTRMDAEAFVRDVAADPKLLEDRATLAYGYRLALDDAAAPTVLSGLSSVDSPIVPDLLFDLATRGEPGARLTILARDLLELRGVRARASKALAIALALEGARDCGTALALLARVETDADDRALLELERLGREQGCGPKKADDCMPCLRDPNAEAALGRAIDAARARTFEPGWTVAQGKR